MVNFCTGTTVNIERNAKFFERLLYYLMVSINNVLRSNAFLTSLERYGNAVFVGTANEEYIAVFQAVVASIDVGRHIHASQMSNMYRSVCIRQSGSNGNSFVVFHFLKILCKITTSLRVLDLYGAYFFNRINLSLLPKIFRCQDYKQNCHHYGYEAEN